MTIHEIRGHELTNGFNSIVNHVSLVGTNGTNYDINQWLE